MPNAIQTAAASSMHFDLLILQPKSAVGQVILQGFLLGSREIEGKDAETCCSTAETCREMREGMRIAYTNVDKMTGSEIWEWNEVESGWIQLVLLKWETRHYGLGLETRERRGNEGMTYRREAEEDPLHRLRRPSCVVVEELIGDPDCMHGHWEMNERVSWVSDLPCLI